MQDRIGRYFLIPERYSQNVCKRHISDDWAPCSRSCDKDNSQTLKTTGEIIYGKLSTMHHWNYTPISVRLYLEYGVDEGKGNGNEKK